MAFNPKYTVTPKILNALARIEAVRHEIMGLPVATSLLASLRDSASLASTHHSTAIEGNLLTPQQVQEVIRDGKHFPNRQKDESEVWHYYKALEYVEVLAKKNVPIQEQDVKTLHGLSFLGKKKPTVYRDGQNVIRKGRLIVYIPPKAGDVPVLMKQLVEWIGRSAKEGLPLPIIAGRAHYQFAAIHPYYDGNGRTARLLATLILHKYGYGLKGIYSLEEYYAKNLQGYYAALEVGSDEDYYEGERSRADLTGFLEYFVHGMSEAFEKVCFQARTRHQAGNNDHSPLLRTLAPNQRQLLKLFISSREITARDVGDFFHCNDRQARYLCQKWVREGFFKITDPSLRGRKYQLAQRFENLVCTTLTL